MDVFCVIQNIKFLDPLRKGNRGSVEVRLLLSMRVLLELLDPSTHWIALARVIENNPDLPSDALMVVRKDGVVLREAACDVPLHEIARGSFPDGAVSDLKGKLALLEWVHEQFADREMTPN